MKEEKTLREKVQTGVVGTMMIAPLAYALGLGACRGYADMPVVPEEIGTADGAELAGMGALMMAPSIDSLISGDNSRAAQTASLAGLIGGPFYICVAHAIGYGLGKLAKLIC